MIVIKVELEKKLGGLQIEARFEMNGQGTLALFGPSGAGKTSIVNMMAGLMSPDRGRVVIGDRDLFDSARKINTPPHRRRIGYIFQDARLFPHLSVKSNLNYGRKLVPKEERYIRVADVVEVLGIGHLLDRRPHNLSGGEKQRTAIGRALLTSPRLLMMDEPLTSLDESRKAGILALIAEIPARFGVPVLYVSHSLEELQALSAQVVQVESGRAVA